MLSGSSRRHEDASARVAIGAGDGACVAASLGCVDRTLEHLTPMPRNGVLESFERIEDSTLLKLTMRFEMREYVGMLTRDPPPSIEAVEQLLQANLGREIGEIGELDV